MKSLIILSKRVLSEVGELVGTDTTRDWETVTRRLKTEGLSFLTLTLPAFAKEFEYCLSEGRVLTSNFLGFKRSKKSGQLPCFLQGFVSSVFDSQTGRLLDEPLTEAIFGVRQFCLLHSKIRLPVSPKRERKAILGYVECEKEMFRAEEADREGVYHLLNPVFTALFGDILCRLDSMVYYLDDGIVPKHGPGSTADRLGSNERWRLDTWTERLESIFPAWYLTVPNEKWAAEALAYRKPLLEPGAEPPVRVITVPKTMKTPRIIAKEPAHMQYVQQALRRLLVQSIEDDSLLRHLIYFSDQTPNQELARRGSISGQLATLDLSEASDRVSNLLVLQLFEPWPHLSAAIQACRSTRADVPGHGIMPLTKFASMGSALTFPIEAMVFLAIAILSCMETEKLNRSAVRKRAKKLSSEQVAIYGDDIIVPTDHVQGVIANLELFGFKINAHKSFWNGKFRESCGKEYFNGQDVSIVKWREKFPKSRLHARELVSAVSTRNLFYSHGLWQVASWIDGRLERLIGVLPCHLPCGSDMGEADTSSWLSRLCSILPKDDELIRPRWNPRLHRHEIRAWIFEGRPPIDKIDGLPALTKVLVRDEATTSVDDRHFDGPRVVLRPHDHFVHAGRPKASRLTLRWVPVSTGT